MHSFQVLFEPSSLPGGFFISADTSPELTEHCQFHGNNNILPEQEFSMKFSSVRVQSRKTRTIANNITGEAAPRTLKINTKFSSQETLIIGYNDTGDSFDVWFPPSFDRKLADALVFELTRCQYNISEVIIACKEAGLDVVIAPQNMYPPSIY